MSADPAHRVDLPMDMHDAQPCVGPLRASSQAGRLWSLREAEDDARAVLAFVAAGMRGRSIDPGHAVWIIDLSPGDGERAWRMLRIFDTQAPRGPPLRYLACCLDAAQHEALAARPCFAAWQEDGRFSLGRADHGLPLHPLRNPVVVLAHEAFSARVQHLFRTHAGRIVQAWRDSEGHVQWRDLRRRDGNSRLLHAQQGTRDGVPLTMPHAAMGLLDTLLRASGGRMLLRATDDGLYEPDRISTEGLRADGVGPPQVNFDALSRWHRANGGQSFQSRGPIDGRVLHVALHDVEGGGLRECLPDVLTLPHPDEHVQLLQVIAMLKQPPDVVRRALLRATGHDPRAWAMQSVQVSAQVGRAVDLEQPAAWGVSSVFAADPSATTETLQENDDG